MSLLAVLVLGVGILLIYSAIKGESPKEVITRALRQR